MYTYIYIYIHRQKKKRVLLHRKMSKKRPGGTVCTCNARTRVQLGPHAATMIVWRELVNGQEELHIANLCTTPCPGSRESRAI
jgi:hypothetical protein